MHFIPRLCFLLYKMFHKQMLRFNNTRTGRGVWASRNAGFSPSHNTITKTGQDNSIRTSLCHGPEKLTDLFFTLQSCSVLIFLTWIIKILQSFRSRHHLLGNPFLSYCPGPCTTQDQDHRFSPPKCPSLLPLTHLEPYAKSMHSAGPPKAYFERPLSVTSGFQ